MAILGNSMINGVFETELKMMKMIKISIKIWKRPDAIYMDILDHIKPSLRKKSDEIIVHAATDNA